MQSIGKNSLFFSANAFEKQIVSKKYCLDHQQGKMYFLPTCRCHILLLGNVEELLQKLDTLCFTYQNVDCIFTLFKY